MVKFYFIPSSAASPHPLTPSSQPQLEDLGKHCKLPRWSPGQSPGRPELLGHFIAQETYKCMVYYHYITEVNPPILKTTFFRSTSGGYTHPNPPQQIKHCLHPSTKPYTKRLYTMTAFPILKLIWLISLYKQKLVLEQNPVGLVSTIITLTPEMHNVQSSALCSVSLNFQ